MKVFFAFAQQDSELIDQIINYTQSPFAQEGIQIWHERKILAGSIFTLEIEKNLSDSDILLFFLSSDFLTSSIFKSIESEVLRRVEKNTLHLIPVLLRPCLWQYTAFARAGLQIFPSREEAISQLPVPKREQTYTELVEAILKIADSRRAVKSRSPFDEPDPIILSYTFKNEEEFIVTLQKLLAKDEVDQVFDILDEVLKDNDSELANTAILLKSRYSRAKASMNRGIVTSENYSVETSHILAGLLDLIQDIPRELRLRGIEASNTYLDSISKTTGFEEEQKDYEILRATILNKENSVNEVFERLQALDFSTYPDLAQRLKTAREDYSEIKNQDTQIKVKKATTEKLDAIREEFLNILGEFEKHKGKEQEQKTQVDVQTADTVYLNEIKLILLGNGGVGKTTLRHNLLTEGAYQLTQHESTIGLDVVTWFYQSQILPGGEKIQFNIWDYGGQGKYRAIQQFFCTPRALYIYVTTPFEQENNQDDDYVGLEYWLEFVRLFGHNPDDHLHSPVIYVMNKCDGGGNQNIAEQQIKQKFSSIKNFIRTRCDNGEGLDELEKAIEERLNETNMMNRSFPKTWANLKTKLQQLAKVQPYISYTEYLDLFEKEIGFNVQDDDQIDELRQELFRRFSISKQHLLGYFHEFAYKFRYSTILDYWQDQQNATEWSQLLAKRMILERKADTFAKYLHDAGIILYFPKANSLKDKLVLDPDWARGLAYQVMDSVYSELGQITAEEIENVFNDERSVYSIDLLTAYGLAYKMEREGQVSYILPSRFPLKKPKNWFDLSTIAGVQQYKCQFEPILPPDFQDRLVVKLFPKVDNENAIWKHGVLLSRPEKDDSTKKTYAQILEHWQSNKLIIYLSGAEWEDFAQEISNDINFLLKNSNIKDREITIQEYIVDRTTQKQISLTELKNKSQNGQPLAPIDLDSANNGRAMLSAKLEQVRSRTKNLLYINACPIGMEQPRFLKEIRAIQDSGISLIDKQQTEADALRKILRDAKTSYVHFSLHGKRNGGLLFINNIEEEEASEVEEKEVISIFSRLKDSITSFEIICFSACHSLKYAKSLASIFPCTIGMDGPFPDKSAALFGKLFYGYLVNGESIEEAFESALWGIKRAKIPPQEDIEVHHMPKLYVNGKPIEINL